MESFKIESSTDGHSHLYIRKLLTHEEYTKMINVLVEVGILGEGTRKQLERDGATSLRLPDVKKSVQFGKVDLTPPY